MEETRRITTPSLESSIAPARQQMLQLFATANEKVTTNEDIAAIRASNTFRPESLEPGRTIAVNLDGVEVPWNVIDSKFINRGTVSSIYRVDIIPPNAGGDQFARSIAIKEFQGREKNYRASLENYARVRDALKGAPGEADLSGCTWKFYLPTEAVNSPSTDLMIAMPLLDELKNYVLGMNGDKRIDGSTRKEIAAQNIRDIANVDDFLTTMGNVADRVADHGIALTGDEFLFQMDKGTDRPNLRMVVGDLNLDFRSGQAGNMHNRRAAADWIMRNLDNLVFDRDARPEASADKAADSGQSWAREPEIDKNFLWYQRRAFKTKVESSLLKQPTEQGPTLQETPDNLPPLPPGFVRMVHITSPQTAQSIRQNGLNYERQGMVSSSARYWANASEVQYWSDDPRFRGEGMKAVVFDLPAQEARLHDRIQTAPGTVPAKYIVGIVDAKKPVSL